MPLLDVDGVNVHYTEAGSGPAVLCLHGGGTSGAQWKQISTILADRYHVVTVDHYGYGRTDPWSGPPTQRTFDAEVPLVRGVMGAMGGPFHVVGHSYGACVALRMVCQDAAGVRSLALLEPGLFSVLRECGVPELAEREFDLYRRFHADLEAGRGEAAWELYIDVYNGPGTWASFSSERRHGFLAMSDTLYSCSHAVMNDTTSLAALRSIALSTLILYGDQSFPRFSRIAAILAETMPHASMAAIQGAGHALPVTHPEPIAERLLAHFRAVEG